MRKTLYETAEPLPADVAEWMGIPDLPRTSNVEDDIAIATEPHSLRSRLRLRLTGRLAS